MTDFILVALMMTITILAYVGYIPQIIRLIKTRDSEGLSITAWIIWIVSCSCGTAYSIILKRPELIITYVSELVLSVIIFILILKYRKPEAKK